MKFENTFFILQILLLGTFYGGSTDINTDVQYPKFNTDILVFPVFYSISSLCFKPPIQNGLILPLIEMSV